MGVCDSDSSLNKIQNLPIENSSIINKVEEKMADADLEKIFKRVFPSICFINIRNIKGVGFLVKIKDLYYLMTNYHLITKELIELKQAIEVEYDSKRQNFKINIAKPKRNIKYDISNDIIIIEIFPENQINENYFLSLYQNKVYLNQEIYIPQYVKDKFLISRGYITKINVDNNELIYNVSPKLESLGYPLFIYDSNELKLIGINKQGNTLNQEYYGSLLNSIILSLNQNEIKFVYENGDYYVGEWKNNLRHGKGKQYNKNDNIQYEGDWAYDKFEGKGKYIWDNGNYYIGQWKNGQSHGKGIEYYNSDLIKYDGDWVEDKFEGNGKYIYENGNYYDGQWKNDLKNGKGIMYYKNKSIKYEGDWLNDKYNGNGKYYYENGNIYYDGQWKDGLKNGKGKIYYKDGTIKYEGIFVNDKYKS